MADLIFSMVHICIQVTVSVELACWLSAETEGSLPTKIDCLELYREISSRHVFLGRWTNSVGNLEM